MLVAVGVSAPDATLDAEPVFAASCIGYCKHPTNAGKVFRWGVESWRQEFETGAFSPHWQSDHPEGIGQQNGMLTIKAESDSGTVKVWPDDQFAVYGRWEARVRAVEKSADGKPYRFTWQLVPVGGDSCGANTIVLASYVPGAARAVGAVRTLPNNAFVYQRPLDLRSRAWHTYAVEVARRPHLVVRGHQGHPHGAAARGVGRGQVPAAVHDGSPRGDRDAGFLDADGLGALLHPQATQREVHRGSSDGPDDVHLDDLLIG